MKGKVLPPASDFSLNGDYAFLLAVYFLYLDFWLFVVEILACDIYICIFALDFCICILAPLRESTFPVMSRIAGLLNFQLIWQQCDKKSRFLSIPITLPKKVLITDLTIPVH